MRSEVEPSRREAAASAGPASPGGASERWALIRDALFLQPKLLLEGLKDLLLGPVALLATALDLVRGVRPGGRRAFHDVLRFGRGFERWLNLYGALPPERGDERSALPAERGGIDTYFGHIERALVEEHERGGVTTRLKQTVDAWLDKLEDLTRR
jgi:hypothetical protein